MMSTVLPAANSAAGITTAVITVNHDGRSIAVSSQLDELSHAITAFLVSLITPPHLGKGIAREAGRARSAGTDTTGPGPQPP